MSRNLKTCDINILPFFGRPTHINLIISINFVCELLNITNNKIKAKITNNMRQGIIATSNVKYDELNFFIDSSCTTNIETKQTKVVINEHDTYENSYNHNTINTLLHKYYDSSQDTTLSLFLLCDKFALLNDSFVWPCLLLLPACEELGNENLMI